MKFYRVKGDPATPEFVKITGENAMGFDVVITKVTAYDKKEYKDFISRALFDACLRTGYLREEPELVGVSA